MLPILRPTVAEIDLTKLTRNLRNIRTQVGPQPEILAILKANAYGHGAVKLGEFIEQNALAQWFGVASVEEGIALREAGLQTPIWYWAAFIRLRPLSTRSNTVWPLPLPV